MIFAAVLVNGQSASLRTDPASQGPMAVDSTVITTKIYMYGDPMDEALSLSMANPALYQYRHDVSLGDINAYRRNGSLADYWRGGADAYIKHKNSTLWGNAHYSNGKLNDIGGCVTVDPQMLYPYFTIVEMPGGSVDMRMETYALSGGYADHQGRWSRGVTLSYDAGLYYRDIDPRPKDVTGRLMLSAGAAYTLNDNQLVALSAGFGKYKQSCDILFVSETGRTPVYHMTGPETCYNRFTGASETSNYSGKMFEATIGVFPKSRCGVIASANVSRFEFTKILTDLNKLPLCEAWHNDISAMVGWVSSRLSVWGSFEAWRRHGTENLFGDATSGVYSQIGALEMYADNHWDASLHAIVDFPVSFGSVYIKAAAGYAHRATIYLEPAYETVDNRCICDTQVGCRAMLRAWTLSASFERLLSGASAEFAPTQHLISWPMTAYPPNRRLNLALTRSIGKYALGFGADWQKDYLNNHHCDLSIHLYF